MNVFAVGLGFGVRWALLYGLLTFVTQLWAGSQYSAGQGGGVAELIRWSVIFGVIAVGVVVERVLNGDRVVEAGASFMAAVVGQAAGTGLALVWFTSKGGPVEGDWWIGPALAALFVALWVHLIAPRVRLD